MNINLKRRYPNSRTEDITDAFSRGFVCGRNMRMSDTEKVFTYEEVKELCRDAFDTGKLYERESTYYGVDAVAYDWKHWLKRHDLASYVAGHKGGVKEGREDMNIQDATAMSYSQGYEDGYEAGYSEATAHWQEDCRQLRECLRAILDKGETPEDSGAKAD